MLQNLIAEAAAIGGGNLCAAGHDWGSDGGRSCPKYEAADCSQTVYVCKRCGAHDYGDKGGPAHRECFVECKRDFAAEIAADAEYGAEATARYEAAASNDASNRTPREAAGESDDGCRRSG